MSTFIVTMRHDAGTVRVLVAASSADDAARIVCAAEGAPLSAVVRSAPVIAPARIRDMGAHDGDPIIGREVGTPGGEWSITKAIP